MSSTLAGLLAQLEQVFDHVVEVLRVQDLLVERRVERQLRVELQAADAREVVLLRVEEHVLEQRPRAVERGRIARPQAAIDLDERFFVRSDRVLASASAPMIGPTSSRSGKNTSMRSTFFSCAIEMTRGVSSSLASRITSPVDGSTMSGGRERAFELGVGDLDRLDTRLPQRRNRRFGDLLAGLDGEVLALGPTMSLAARRPDEAVGDAPSRTSLLQVQLIDGVEGPDDLVRPRRPRARRNTVARNLRLRSMRT